MQPGTYNKHHVSSRSSVRSLTAKARFLSILLVCAHAITANAGDTTPIQWVDLLPESERTAYLKDQKRLVDIPPMPDLGALSSESDNSWLNRKPIGSDRSVDKHNNHHVEIIGYPIPFSNKTQNTQTFTFLLVPELGAGIYLPAPAPNQTVRVNLPKHLAEKHSTAPTPEKPIRITGLLSQSTDRSLPYAYIIEATDWRW